MIELLLNVKIQPSQFLSLFIFSKENLGSKNTSEQWIANGLSLSIKSRASKQEQTEPSVGSFAITIFSLFTFYQDWILPSIFDFILLSSIGFLGGFTTFSAFSMEAFSLLSNEKYLFAVLYVFGSVLLSILGFTFGYFLISKNIWWFL